MPMDAAGKQLVRATIRELRQHPPFDAMEAAALRHLALRLRLGYHSRGQALVGPESGVADRLYIIKQGQVRGGGGPAPAAADVVLGPGECFPIGALTGRRATVYGYRAEDDCFCWELPAEDFHDLQERSARFRAFCLDHLALLVEASQRARRAEAAATLDDGAGMLAPLRGAVTRAPVSCTPDTPLGEVVKAMHAQRVGSIVVIDPSRRPVGIFTTTDLLERVALPQTAPDTPIAKLMSPSPVQLEEEAPLVEAAVAMARRGIRHVVVTRDGRLSGVLSERDLFALQRASLRRATERIHTAESVPSLAEAADEIRQLTRRLLGQGIDAEHATQVTSALNDALSQRLIALAARRHPLPARWCWLALGSEGRLEQTLATDQDNALVFAGEADTRALLAFADEVNRGLAAGGFPLCKGDIMARNPRWCLPLEEWRGVFSGWIRAPQPEALLNAAIFFDFRPIAGDASLAGELREAVTAQAQASPAFLRAMAGNTLRVAPPLGLVRDFVVADGDEFPGTLDLKGMGARPFVDAARVWALARGLAATGTAPRLRAAAEAGALPREEAEAGVGAFHYIQNLRLRRQYLEGPLPPGAENRIDPERLNEIDRRILKAAFRQAALLQDRLRMDYGL
jgi:CBS domain-containing protein